MKKSSKGKKNGSGKLEKMLISASLPRSIIPKQGKTLSYAQSVGPVYQIDIVGGPITNAVAAGALAASSDVCNLTSTVQNFTTRWGAVFREYRIVGARFMLKMYNAATAQGVVRVWPDEKASAAPAAADAQDARCIEMIIQQQSVAAIGSTYEITWMPRDLTDLTFTNTTTGYSPVYLKYYTSAAFGTAAGTSCTIYVAPTYRVQFRGLV